MSVTKDRRGSPGRHKSNAPEACACTGACTPACRAKRRRLARDTAKPLRKKRAITRPGPPKTNAQDLCGCPGACTLACRLRRFRAAHPEKRVARRETYANAAARHTDAIAEHRALSYVRSALRRGSIIPPRACDACFIPSNELAPFHPDPAHPRQIAWLCPEHRRTVPAIGGPLTLGWVWPGVAGSLPRSWSIRVQPNAVALANAAVAADTPNGRIGDPRVVRRWAEALFANSPGLSRERVYTLGARGRSMTGDPQIDGVLAWWATLERDTRNRAAHNDREQVEVAVEITPRLRSRRPAPPDIATIGNVPMPPASSRPGPLPVKRSADEEEAALAQIDASLAAVDKLLERFNTTSRLPKRQPDYTDADD